VSDQIVKARALIARQAMWGNSARDTIITELLAAIAANEDRLIQLEARIVTLEDTVKAKKK